MSVHLLKLRITCNSETGAASLLRLQTDFFPLHATAPVSSYLSTLTNDTPPLRMFLLTSPP